MYRFCSISLSTIKATQTIAIADPVIETRGNSTQSSVRQLGPHSSEPVQENVVHVQSGRHLSVSHLSVKGRASSEEGEEGSLMPGWVWFSFSSSFAGSAWAE